MTDFLNLVKNAFESSTSFIDNNYRSKWEDNIRHFQSRHRAGSKYYKESYKYRSKIFRPKTRSVIRGNEAAAVAAFFSNEDIVSIEPVDNDNPIQVASASIKKELLNIRLTRHIPWYLTLIGGLQDAQVIGVVCSLQEWEYDDEEIIDQVAGPDGQPKDEVRYKIHKDQPAVTLIPIENLRISPNSKWTDPINDSPYLIHIIPMYLMDIRNKIDSGKWKDYEDQEIFAASKKTYDTIKYERSGEGIEPDESEGNNESLTPYTVVYVHKNFVRVGRKDYEFYTVGTELLMTDPIPSEDGRMYAFGYGVIEAHKFLPDSIVELGSNLQQETNEVANQRSDNVKLVLNKRWKVKRGSQVDLANLVRNVPGGAILMNDPQTDVIGENFPDVTQSAYMEQDRLNVDFDELMGSFSASTIQTNRRMNETVGGMAMLRGTSNTMVEYLLRTFGETWVEEVMRQLIYLEEKYETDQMILSIAANKAKLFQRFNIDKVTNYLLSQQVTTKVNVGMGATDPQTKIQKLLMAIQSLAQLSQAPIPGLKFDEIVKEVFGYLGWKDGKRFIDEADQKSPELMQAQQMIQAMQQEIEKLQKQLLDKQQATEAKLIQTKMKEEGETKRTELEAQTDILTTQMDNEQKLAVAAINQRAAQARISSGRK
jgi:hypothetical protein